jgi:hypothetical protein
MEFAVAVRRRTGKPRRERAFREEERVAGVLAGGLDDDLRRAGVVVLAFSGPVKNRIHVVDLTPRIPATPGCARVLRLAARARTGEDPTRALLVLSNLAAVAAF